MSKALNMAYTASHQPALTQLEDRLSHKLTLTGKMRKPFTLGDVAKHSCPLHAHGMTLRWLYRPAVSRVRAVLQL